MSHQLICIHQGKYSFSSEHKYSRIKPPLPTYNLGPILTISDLDPVLPEAMPFEIVKQSRTTAKKSPKKQTKPPMTGSIKRSKKSPKMAQSEPVNKIVSFCILI